MSNILDILMYKIFDIIGWTPVHLQVVTVRKKWRVELGKRLRQLRTAQRLSQGDLAERIGRGRATIFNYETGREAPSLEVLAKICECLGSATFVVDGQRFEIGADTGARRPRAVPRQLRLKLGIVCSADRVQILPSKHRKQNRLDVEVLSA